MSEVSNVIGIAIGAEVNHARIHIDLDGTVTLAEGVSLDEGSELFWNMIARAVRAIQPYEMRRLRRRLSEKCPGAPEMESPAPHTLGGFARRWVDNHGTEPFVASALVELVDCFRTQGHNGESAAITLGAFMELMADYENAESAEWGQFWMTEAGQSLRLTPPIKRNLNYDD